MKKKLEMLEMLKLFKMLKMFIPTSNAIEQAKRLSKRSDVTSNGFTLLEMIISIGVFSALVIISIGITLGISNAQVKAQNTQSVLDNIRFSMELITKEMRTGSGYELSTICSQSGSEITFTTSTGQIRVYFLDAGNGRILRATTGIDSEDCAGLGKALPFTSEEVLVDRFKIRLNGATPGSVDGQPRATISLKVTSRDPRIQYRSTMDLQTTVVQRLRDL